ncbi:nucleoporin NUP188 homolog [Chelonus insularis]|uniref:nucleoporin NUP188 homolog n=1 Tax=Chelonus insularis TaxID=460826 RepID=UPI00158AA633|nr:nucleoporin NUP188 homolog [Chelonus insularis]
MQVESLGNLPYCKVLWSVISSTTIRCDKALVIEEINHANDLLKEGLLFFKNFTEASLQKFEKTNPPPRMFDLISKLAPFLNLDTSIAWDLTCNYMMYEYRSSAETFASQLSDLTSINVLIEELWNFYHSERITMIKCLKLMIEYRDNQNHPYQKEFADFFKTTPLESILQSSLKQIDRLKFNNISNRSHLLTEEHLYKLYFSTLIEMRELLHIVTMILDTIRPTSFDGVYESICGEPRRIVSTKSHEEKETVTKKLEEIRQCQAACFVVILDVTKQIENDSGTNNISSWIKNMGNSIHDILEHKYLRDTTLEDGPLLLAWMLANYAIEPDNTEILNRFRPFGIRAIQLEVFKTLKNLMESEMMNETTRYSQVVRTSVYNLLSLLCTFIDEDRVSSFEGIFDATAAILRYPETATEFWRDRKEEAGLWPIFNRAIALFPYRFEPLTCIAIGLANASTSSAQKIAAKLEDLESVTLEGPRYRNFSGGNTSGRQAFRPYNQECTLHHNNFTIPENCERLVLDHESGDKEVVVWRVKSRYGDAFHHKIEQLFSFAGSGIMNVSDVQTNLPDHVAQGYGLLEALLNANVEIPAGMVIPTELSLEVINRFSYPVLPKGLYRVVAACFSVTSKLALKYPDEILTRMRVGIYPKFNDWYQDTKELARAISFDGGLVASWLSGVETIEHRYPVLSAYLYTLYNYLVSKHTEEAMYNMEIPGMVFLLQGVLPKLDSWYFSSETERIELWLRAMSCIHHTLDTNLSKSDPRKKLQLVVAYSLLYLEPRHALLKFVRTGEKNLRMKMMSESDWISGKGFKIIESVRLALSLVNRLLMFRKSLGLSHDERSPLEIALYTSPSLPNGLLIVPTIVNYLYVEFSPSLQAMAVSLLKKFAQGFSMSLLVCMGMNGTSIRHTFASRLMSPTCSVKVKVAILELVTVCLERQPGLTEALFNILHQEEKKRMFPPPPDQFSTKGCHQFLNLYLQRIADEKNIIYDKLYDNTMSLLRAMWYNRNTILVNYFRKRENFWSQLFSPLFRPFVKGSRGYAYLIDVATLELFESSPPSLPENDFTKNLEKLLYQDNYWELIVEYILDNIPQDKSCEKPDDDTPIESPLYEANIEAWYHFIVTLTDKKIANKLMSKMEASKIQFMTRITLKSLSVKMKQTNNIGDARITMLLASLALRCVFTWKLKCVDDQQDFVDKIVQLMEDLFHSYNTYGVALRRILVSLLLGCVQLVKDTIIEDKANLEYLLVHSCLLSNIELRKLRDALKKTRELQTTTGSIKHISEEESDMIDSKFLSESNRVAYESTPVTLTISMVTQLLRCTAENQHKSSKFGSRSACLHLRQMIPELMNCLNSCLQNYRYLGFSRAALEFLATVARLPYYNPPPAPIEDPEAIANLWLALIPPASLGQSILNSLYDDRTTQGQWSCQDWWIVYTLGLEFLNGMAMNSIGIGNQTSCPPTYVTSIIIFLGSHEHQLTEVATLLRHTADLLAVDLVQSLVALISTLTMRSIIWEMIQPEVREGLMKCMYLIYDSTVNLLLRPRILKFIIDGVSVESAEDLHWCDEKLPSNELKLLVNKLIVINWWCAQCFVRFSPRLNALVDTIYTQNFWHTPLAEMNFGPPQMSMSSGPSLTYGTIISSTQLFTQALNSHLSSTSTNTTVTGGTNIPKQSSKDGMDSAKFEWERATPEIPRKIHSKDLRRFLSLTRPAFPYFSISGNTSNVGLFEHPRLLRRPYDPLICENTILSRTTSFSHHGGRHVSKNGIQSSQGQSSNIGQSIRVDSNPWFDSMNENNSRLALEVNLVLVLCQTLEGVKSPRLALRDRQLIARETANEIGIFFDFLEQKASNLNEWEIEGALVGIEVDGSLTKVVKPPIKQCVLSMNARLRDETTVNKPSVDIVKEHDPGEGTSRQSERLDICLNENIISTGSFNIDFTSVKFLSLLGKLFKSTLESLDSAQFG